MAIAIEVAEQLFLLLRVHADNRITSGFIFIFEPLDRFKLFIAMFNSLSWSVSFLCFASAIVMFVKEVADHRLAHFHLLTMTVYKRSDNLPMTLRSVQRTWFRPSDHQPCDHCKNV